MIYNTYEYKNKIADVSYLKEEEFLENIKESKLYYLSGDKKKVVDDKRSFIYKNGEYVIDSHSQNQPCRPAIRFYQKAFTWKAIKEYFHKGTGEVTATTTYYGNYSETKYVVDKDGYRTYTTDCFLYRRSLDTMYGEAVYFADYIWSSFQRLKDFLDYKDFPVRIMNIVEKHIEQIESAGSINIIISKYTELIELCEKYKVKPLEYRSNTSWRCPSERENENINERLKYLVQQSKNYNIKKEKKDKFSYIIGEYSGSDKALIITFAAVFPFALLFLFVIALASC